MEELIRQAFLHIEVIGPHVAEGHYDLVGPNGDIILPQVWETVIEPDWTITMHMWPIPEKPTSPDPAEGGTAPETQAPGSADSAVVVASDDSKKKSEPAAGMFRFPFHNNVLWSSCLGSPFFSYFLFLSFSFPFLLGCSEGLFEFPTRARLFCPGINLPFDLRCKEATCKGARPRRFCDVDGW
jgi:hypothetical protein